MNRLRNLSTFVLASSVLATFQAHAEKATDDDMALSALEAEARTSNPFTIRQYVGEARREIEARAEDSAASHDLVAASIVFNRGFTAEEVARLTDDYGFEIASIESKDAVGEEGTVITISIGARDLLLVEGGTAERLNILFNSHRMSLLATARGVMSNPNARDEERDSAERFLEAGSVIQNKFYKMEVIGQLDAVGRVLADVSVEAVFMDLTGSKLENYLLHKRTMVAQRSGMPAPIRRRLEDGPPPGVPLDKIIMLRPMPDMGALPRPTGQE